MSTFKMVNAMKSTHKSHMFIDRVKWGQDTDGWEMNGMSTLKKSELPLTCCLCRDTKDRLNQKWDPEQTLHLLTFWTCFWTWSPIVIQALRRWRREDQKIRADCVTQEPVSNTNKDTENLKLKERKRKHLTWMF